MILDYSGQGIYVSFVDFKEAHFSAATKGCNVNFYPAFNAFPSEVKVVVSIIPFLPHFYVVL